MDRMARYSSEYTGVYKRKNPPKGGFLVVSWPNSGYFSLSS